MQLPEERRGTRATKFRALGTSATPDGFRAAKPITVFAELIARNRVNCNLTTRCYPGPSLRSEGAAETSTFAVFSRLASSFVVRTRACMHPTLRPRELPSSDGKELLFSRVSFLAREKPSDPRISNPFTYATPFASRGALPPPPPSSGNNNFSTATFFEDLNFPRSYFRSKSGPSSPRPWRELLAARAPGKPAAEKSEGPIWKVSRNFADCIERAMHNPMER